MRVTIAVSGKFHYFNYCETLYCYGVLGQFVYSHRLRSRQQLGRAAPVAINCWLKEYLYQGHIRLLGSRGLSTLSRLYHCAWERQLVKHTRAGDIFHFLLHGNCGSAVRKMRPHCRAILGDAVNSHPRDFLRILNEECDDLGVKNRVYTEKSQTRMLNEISLTTHMLTPSRFVAESYVRWGYPADKLFVLPYGGNLAQFSPGVPLKHVFKVVCVAQVAPRKGHQYLLRAWKRLSLHNAELHLYGMIDQECLSVLKKINAANVFFHGAVPKSEIIAALQSASTFVLPTVEEGFAVSILEAMACGLPVVTTTASGADGIITDGLDGYLVAPRNVEEICTRLEQLYKNSELRESMGAAARLLVVKQYNWGNYAQKLVQLYQRILNEDPGDKRSSPVAASSSVI